MDIKICCAQGSGLWLSALAEAEKPHSFVSMENNKYCGVLSNFPFYPPKRTVSICVRLKFYIPYLVEFTTDLISAKIVANQNALHLKYNLIEPISIHSLNTINVIIFTFHLIVEKYQRVYLHLASIVPM